MALEATATYIDSLVEANPGSVDTASSGYRHCQLIKGAIKRTFPNLTGSVTASHGALSYAKDLESTLSDQLTTVYAELNDKDRNDYTTNAYTIGSSTYTLTADGQDIALFSSQQLKVENFGPSDVMLVQAKYAITPTYTGGGGMRRLKSRIKAVGNIFLGPLALTDTAAEHIIVKEGVTTRYTHQAVLYGYDSDTTATAQVSLAFNAESASVGVVVANVYMRKISTGSI